MDLVLLDLHLPGNHGLSGLAWLRGHYPALPVVLISAHDEPDIIQRALADGAAGFLSKSSESEVIIEAIGQVMAGETWVPDGLQASASEPDHTELARRVGELTPQQYHILRKLGVHNRTQAVTLFSRLDIGRQGWE